MTKVGVAGAAGRMGRLIAETVAYATGHDLAALYDRFRQSRRSCWTPTSLSSSPIRTW